MSRIIVRRSVVVVVVRLVSHSLIRVSPSLTVYSLFATEFLETGDSSAHMASAPCDSFMLLLHDDDFIKQQQTSLLLLLLLSNSMNFAGHLDYSSIDLLQFKIAYRTIREILVVCMYTATATHPLPSMIFYYLISGFPSKCRRVFVHIRWV